MSDQKSQMKDMLANAVHFGHKSTKWNPKMKPYLYGVRDGVHIFDLNKTFVGLIEAKNFLKLSCSQGKTVLMVSTKQQCADLLQSQAEACKMPYVTKRWIPGLLTNFKTVKARVKYMQKLRDERDNGGFDKYTKKEALEFGKEIEKLEYALSGVEHMERTPDIVFVVDVCRDKIAVKEARKVGAKVVAIVDSNSDPDDVDYIIPGNDDAIKAITYIVNEVAGAINEGKLAKK